MNAPITQRAFAAALRDPARAAPPGLRVPTGVDPQRRFDVHRNNTVMALVDALAAAFPVTRALVGETFFRAMARERIRLDPPRSPIVADYGQGFAAFIAGFPPAHGVPYLPDMARLEYLRVQAYHAADAQPLEASAYQQLLATPERLAAARLRLHPACAWLRSDYAVRSLWAAHQDSDRARDAALEALDTDASEALLVTRPQWQVHVSAMPPAGVAWLDALRGGASLGETALLTDLEDDSQAGAQYHALLVLLIQHGLAVALEHPTE
jgi:hypothetical protein